MTLAYVFWHWPLPTVTNLDYEKAIIAFQQRLQDQGPADLIDAAVWRVTGTPWMPGGEGYEDWYLLPDTAALQALNDGAVSPPVRPEHDAVARMAAGGVAGIYYPAAPETRDVPQGERANWFAKPSGWSYATLYDRLEEQSDSLWVRMMVLGPTPELCLINDETVGAPVGEMVAVSRRFVWQGNRNFL